MKYRLTVTDWGRYGLHGHRREFDGITLTKAWKLAQRHARRGLKLYGGKVVRSNWGMRGGDFPAKYRGATITMAGCSPSF